MSKNYPRIKQISNCSEIKHWSEIPLGHLSLKSHEEWMNVNLRIRVYRILSDSNHL